LSQRGFAPGDPLNIGGQITGGDLRDLPVIGRNKHIRHAC
jgi:hypothetical protein